jgi:hypothetical protein
MRKSQYYCDNNEFVELSIRIDSNVRGGSTMGNLIADLRYAARTLVKTLAERPPTSHGLSNRATWSSN